MKPELAEKIAIALVETIGLPEGEIKDNLIGSWAIMILQIFHEEAKKGFV
jgi:hypothetical protein